MGKDVYTIITEKIIEKLEAGTIPWRKPWNTPEPKNLISKKVYRGINYFLLNCLSDEYWLTYKQAQTLGGEVRKGSKGVPVVYWAPTKYVTKEKPEDEKKGLLMRYYTVFAASDVDGIVVPEPTHREKPTVADVFGEEHKAQCIIHNMPNRPEIEYTGNRAYYSPFSDTIHLPAERKFFSTEEFYGTAFHELVHSTGHLSRLNRKEVTNSEGFKSHSYGLEELVAELGSAFLCAHSDIDSTLDNSASYIQSWITTIKGNPKMIISAAGRAQKAADYILNTQLENI
jgi:antirestriction protein ArdC